MTQKSNNIPVGYKDSPLGIIPQEWEVKRLGEIGTFYGGGTPSKSIDEYWHGDIPWISSADLIENDIYWCNVNRFITLEAVRNSSTQIIPQNSILIVTRVGVGKVAVAPCDLCVSQDYICLQNSGMNTIFLAYEIMQRMKSIVSQIQGTSIKGISINEVKKIQLSFPPLAEQEKIAEILTTWDKAIEKQTQLIQKLELRKKGLMQQLLTGKKRLPGFTDEWKKVKLGEVTTFLSCNTFSREQMNNVCGNLKNVHYGDILVKYSSIVDISRDKDSIPYVNDTIEYSPKDYVASGDIVMADTAEDEMVGRACEFINVGEEKIISGLHTILIRPIILFAPMFLGYYLNSREYHKQILSIMQGIKVYSITKEALKNTTIKYPDIQEQTAIANILSSCDNEIRLAQDKLAAMKEQKKGLMQVLLTGKRIVK